MSYMGGEGKKVGVHIIHPLPSPLLPSPPLSLLLLHPFPDLSSITADTVGTSDKKCAG